MATLLNLYQTLLEVYTQQVKGIEEGIKEAEKKEGHHIGGIPHRILNVRMFTYDEYLTNIYNGGMCFEEKNRVMPHLMNFLAAHEKSSDEAKAEFENLKPKGKYQQYLDEIYLDKVGKGAFIEFLQSQLKELHHQERNRHRPSKPQRSNATRQLAQYREDLEKYEKDIESLNRCRQEVNDRINLFNELLNNFP